MGPTLPVLGGQPKPLTLGAIRTRLLWRASSELMSEAARGKGTFTEGCSTRGWFTGNWMGTRYELTRGSSGFIFRPGRRRTGEGRGRAHAPSPPRPQERRSLPWAQIPLRWAQNPESDPLTMCPQRQEEAGGPRPYTDVRPAGVPF